jgi:hypothetical protein
LLNCAPILIVEDELLIALELQLWVEDAEGQVVGPVGSANAALAWLQTCVVAAAILDVQLTDGDATPIADALAAREVPMVFQSGQSSIAPTAQIPQCDLLPKAGFGRATAQHPRENDGTLAPVRLPFDPAIDAPSAFPNSSRRHCHIGRE